MIMLKRGGFRIEAAAVPDSGGFCCVTAEVFEGARMVRGYYRRVQVPASGFPGAEREVAEDVARMTSESE
jgi:hypothetical protein